MARPMVPVRAPRVLRGDTSTALLLCLLATAAAVAQAAPRPTNIGALLAFPGFFHAQQVVVRGDVEHTGDTIRLVAEREAVRVAFTGSIPAGPVEARGEFWDLGRMTPDDPRLTEPAVRDLVAASVGADWPKPGETLLLRLSSVQAASPARSPTLRSIVLEPGRYVGERVTLAGQFRGRNLYGDLPQAPGRSRWDFVLRSANAVVWVAGARPRGAGFNLDVNARVDTGRWLEVTGVVRQGRGLIWIEATDLRLGRPVAEMSEPEAAAAPPMGPAPEVVFSAPTQDETDVVRSTLVRIQFSRDIEVTSFKGRVRVGYLSEQSAERGEPQPPEIRFATDYEGGRQVLVIRFSGPLDRFRTVKVELLDGIVATDGARLKPWTLTFNTGGFVNPPG